MNTLMSRTLRSYLFPIALFFFAFLLTPSPASAQTETTGAFEGQVTNTQTKEPIAGAIVQFINQETQVQSAARTNSEGRFTRYQLQPGTYIIRVRVAGYKLFEKTQSIFITQTRQVIPLPVGLEPEVAVVQPTPPVSTTPRETTPTTTPTPPTSAQSSTTTPGTSVASGTSEEDETGISAENTTDGRRGGSFTDKEVSTLPLGATTLVRTFDELALLLPGVAPPPQTQGSVAGPGIGAGVGSAGQFSVNGLRSRANNFTVDGSDNNDEDIGVRRQGFLALVPQPVESIKEYQVTTLLAPAQYGRNFGAQVNAVSKSGGNEYHGTFFGFLNSSQLNSRDFFDTTNGNATAALRAANNQPALIFSLDPSGNRVERSRLTVRNGSGGEDSFTLGQGGLAFGGPLVPARENSSKSMFFFISAEGHILNATKEASFAVPTLEQRGFGGTGATGISVNPITGDPEIAFPASLAGNAIFSHFPFPNNPGGVYRENTFTQVLPASGQSKILSGKVDANFRAFEVPHQFVARYNFTDDFRDIPVTGGALFSSLRPRVRTQNFSTILNSQLTDSFSNELRASYGRTRLIFDERRDTEFLRPSSFTEASRDAAGNLIPARLRPEDQSFLLNTGFLFNSSVLNGFFCPPTTPSCVPFLDLGDTDEFLGPVGQISIAGFSPVGVDVFNFPQRRVNNTYQLADTMTVGLGRHRIAFGTDIRRVELNSDLPRNSRTLITFNGAPRLLFPDATSPDFRFSGFISPIDLAAASAASGTFQTLAAPGSSSDIGLRYYQFYFFGQDEWRVRPNLSLSFGLRYEYTTPPREVNRDIESTFNSPAIAQLLPNLRQFIDGRSEIFDPDRDNFAPRLGIAYSPRPSTVIRAGYGWYFDQIIGAVVSQSRNTFPNFLTLNSSGGLGSLGAFNIFNFASPSNGILFQDTVPRPGCGPFSANDARTFCPYTAPGTINGLNPSIPVGDVVDVNNREFVGGFGITLPARNLSTPMAQHYSLTIEQQIGSNMVVSAAYVGTQGRHLLRSTTPNLGPNTILLPIGFGASNFFPSFSGIVLPPGATVTSNGFVVGGRPVGTRSVEIIPGFSQPASTVGSVNIYETSANSRYDALQLQVRGRYARRLLYQAQYTFSKGEDDVSDVFDLAGASALPQNSFTRAGERADSNFDARHRFSYNLTYGFSTFSDRSRAAQFWLGGLELASTGQFQTGQPFTVNSIFDVNLDGNLTDRLNTTTGIVETGDRQQPLILQTNPANLLATPGQDGSIPRNSFRTGNLLLLNLAVIKNFRFTETQALTFRTEIFNVTNRANFGVPIRFLESPGFGRATETVTPGRRIQFALKYSF